MNNQPIIQKMQPGIGESLRVGLCLPLLNLHCSFRTGGIWSQLRKSEWWSRAELEQLQTNKLLKLLRSSANFVPYYQNQDLQYQPLAESMSPWEILAQLPILTRTHIKNAGAAIRNPRSKRVFKSRTGGTTGEPLVIWRDIDTVSISEAALWRGKAWAGINPHHKAIAIKGFGKGSWYGRLRLRLLRKWPIPAFQPGAVEQRRTIDLIHRVRPASVEGFVTDLLSVAEGQDLSAAGVRVVFTTGEMLYPEQKKALEHAFSARVISYYGCNEISGVAFECEYGHMHITDEHVIVEAVDESGALVWDQPGRLLVTDLDNHTMPLIRYELGDVGILSKEICRCGRQLLVLKELHGRQQDAICNEKGDRLSATFFAGRFRDLQHVGRMQLVQHDWRAVEILYEGNEGKAAEELRSITNEIHTRLGDQIKVWTTQVEMIPLTPRGKRLLIRGLPAGEQGGRPQIEKALKSA